MDVNGAYFTHRSIEVGKQLEQLGVFHFEQPRPSSDLQGLGHVADILTIPIASGENLFLTEQFHDLIEIGHADIIQSDIIKVPGFSEMLQVQTVAQFLGSLLLVIILDLLLARLHICIFAQLAT